MRRPVDHARTKKRDSGGKEENSRRDEARFVASNEKPVDLVTIDDALNELAGFDERQAEVVELKYSAGMIFDEKAEVLVVSNVTVRRDWDMAKARLFQKIKN